MIDIPGFEGLYAITEDGMVWSHPKKCSSKKGMYLKQGLNTWGYPQVVLCKQGKRYSRLVHALMAITYIGKNSNKYDVCHNNGNKLDNCLNNLRYDTKSNNCLDRLEHGTQNTTILSINDVRAIRIMYTTGKYLQKDLASMFHVSSISIHNIVNKKTWRHV